MPAHAEIIVEGEVNLEDLFDEEEIIAATMYALPKKQKLPELNVTAITMRADRPIYRNHQAVPDTDHQALPGCATRRCGLRAGVAEGLGQGRPGRLPGSGWVIGDRRAARKTTRTRRAMTTDERAGLESDPIVPYADPADLPAPLRSAIESYRQRMGFLPNALKLYMYRPQILKCLIEINNTIMRDASGHLDEGLERRIAAVCSALDHSPCCVAHNANTLKSSVEGEGEGWGWSDAEVRALLDPGFEPDDPVEAACFAFARAATRDPSDVPQTVIARLTEALTPPQVIELACVAGFWRMYDSIHESLYVPVDRSSSRSRTK